MPQALGPEAQLIFPHEHICSYDEFLHINPCIIGAKAAAAKKIHCVPYALWFTEDLPLFFCIFSNSSQQGELNPAWFSFQPNLLFTSFSFLILFKALLAIHKWMCCFLLRNHLFSQGSK